MACFGQPMFWVNAINLQTSSTRYIKEYRLEKAYQMLTQTNKPMAEISALCGVNNSYFSKMIREETGLTPMEYRRNHRRSNDSKNKRNFQSDD